MIQPQSPRSGCKPVHPCWRPEGFADPVFNAEEEVNLSPTCAALACCLNDHFDLDQKLPLDLCSSSGGRRSEFTPSSLSLFLLVGVVSPAHSLWAEQEVTRQALRLPGVAGNGEGW